MGALRFGRELGMKIRGPEAAKRDAERSAAMDAWAVRHPLVATLLGAVVSAFVGWAVAGRLDATTTTEIIIWQVICIPVGVVAMWVTIARARRRRASGK